MADKGFEMALSVKFALLSCLMFTSGMCWLINQVGRSTVVPTANVANPEPTTMTSTSRAPGTPATLITAKHDARRAGQLGYESPVLEAQTRSEPAGNIVLVNPSPVIADRPHVPPPPVSSALLQMRIAAEEGEAGVAGAGTIAEETISIADLSNDDDVRPAPLSPHVRLVSDNLQSLTAYTVAKGDTLWKISRDFYGDQSTKGKDLILAENPKLARRPKQMLMVGEVLQIPPLAGAVGNVTDLGGMEASATLTATIVAEPPTTDAVSDDAETPNSAILEKAAREDATKTASAAKPARSKKNPSRVASAPKTSGTKKTSTTKANTAKAVSKSRSAATAKTANAKSGKKGAARAAPPSRKSAASMPTKKSGGKKPTGGSPKNARRVSIEEAQEVERAERLSSIGVRVGRLTALI